jgi:hypothetical protein
MRELLALGVAFTLAASSLHAEEALTTAPEATAPASGAKVWVGRHAEIEEYLRTAPIERIEKVGHGVTDPDRAFFVPGGLAESALVKPLPPRRQGGYWESYKSEIAAYELDRLLGLDMVPVTVERRIDGLKASVQLWLKGCRRLKEVGTVKPSRPLDWAKQVCRQRIFDALAANIDRNSQNVLVDGEGNLILIDHSRAFAANTTPFIDEITRTDRELFEALKALDEETVTERLKPWLFGKSSVRALLERRDKIVERLEGLLETRGETAVFPF